MKILTVVATASTFLSSGVLLANDCREVLQDAFASGRDANSIVGVHGTSVPTLEFMLNHGYLPFGQLKILRGKIYFYATYNNEASRKALSAFEDEIEIFSFEEAERQAASYASYSHQMKLLVTRVGRSVADLYADSDLYEALDNLITSEVSRLVFDAEQPSGTERLYIVGERWFQYLRSIGLDFEDMRELRSHVLRQKGILLYFDARVLTDFEVRNGYSVDEPDEGTVIIIPNDLQGLPVSYVVGIEPQGNEEWGEVERILSNP